MMLIPCDPRIPETSGLNTVINTPLGNVVLDGEFDGVALAHTPRASARYLPAGGRHIIWESPEFHAECLICRPKSQRLKTISVEDCWAGLFRVKAGKNIVHCEFTCRWVSGYTWTNFGPDSGEGLDGQDFWREEHLVAIGTEDAVWMQKRAVRGDFMPTRWASLIRSGERASEVQYLPDGLRTPLPPLHSGEACQVHYVIAWDIARAGCHHAPLMIDASPREILAGC